jgi:hypothetical protein
VRAVRKITNQRSAALLESLTSETKLIPVVQPGAGDVDAAPPVSAPPDGVTNGDAGDGTPLAKVSVASGKPDDETQTGNVSYLHSQIHLHSIPVVHIQVICIQDDLT